MAGGETKAVAPAWRVLHRRWTLPRKELSFWTFLLVGIVILGGLAVWIELYRYVYPVIPAAANVPEGVAGAQTTSHEKDSHLAALQLALATAGMAIAGPAAMQLLYSRDKLAIVTAILLFTVEIIAAMYLMVFGEAAKMGTFVGGMICIIPAIVAWVLANGEDEIFQDELKEDVSAGGDPMRDLAGGSGPVKV